MDTTPETSPAPAWCGWWRPSRRARWTLFCQAESYGDAWDMLLDLAPPGHGGELLVVRGGVDPNEEG